MFMTEVKAITDKHYAATLSHRFTLYKCCYFLLDCGLVTEGWDTGSEWIMSDMFLAVIVRRHEAALKGSQSGSTGSILTV